MRLPFVGGLGVAAGAVGAVGAGAVGYLLRRSLPPLDGELQVRGLGARVEVVRDRWGIPHVSAQSLLDALFAQGYCHAQDRLWQMEISRRLARGRLAEALGEPLLEVDRFMRRLGLHRAAQREWDLAGPDVRRALEAYAAGVNACLDRLVASGKLPIELVLTKVQPRPWEPIDSLSYGRYVALSLAPNWESELVRSRLIARLGPRRAAELEPEVWRADESADVLPELDDWGPSRAPSIPPPAAGLGGPPVLGGPPASNAWVVAADRSSTGSALLANDPHLFPRLPSVFYEVHLAGGGELNVAGASMPGLPGVQIGHNRRIAWGITASMVDVQDFFVERQDPSDWRRTEYEGRWETGTAIREVIHVKGRAQPWVEDVLVTRHGPLLTPTPLIPDEHRTLALQSCVLEAPETARALLGVNRANDWDEFRAALESWETPSLNLVYADVDGHIGFQMVGRVPIRARGRGLVPAPGWTSRYAWRGSVPFDELPRAFDPPDGVWAVANHDATRGNRYFYGREFIDPARYRRIRQVLDAKDRHSAVDFGVMQADEVSLPGREVAHLLAARLHPATRPERRAVAELAAWDGRMSADSAAASIYAVFRNELVRARYGELFPIMVGTGLHARLAPVSSFYFLQTGRVLARVKAWADERAADHRFPPETDVDRAFRATVRYLRRRFGSNVGQWRWGRLHTLRFTHALSERKPLGALFDLTPIPWSGDLETIRAGGHEVGKLEAGGPISAYRFIADCSDWDASLSCLPGGQSGQRGSPYYADQIDAWRRVAYHPLAFSHPAVRRVARHTLSLTPTGS
jgi:penicillin G amidase